MSDYKAKSATKIPSIDEIKNIFFNKSLRKKRRLSHSIPSSLHDDNFYLHDFELKSSSPTMLTSTNSSVFSKKSTYLPKEEGESDEENYVFFCKNMTSDLKKIAEPKILANPDGTCGDYNTILYNIRNIKTLNSAQVSYILNLSNVRELIDIIFTYDEMYEAIIEYMKNIKIKNFQETWGDVDSGEIGDYIVSNA